MVSSPIIPSQTFDENLSSYQIANILDELLIRALEPLSQHTNVLQHWLAEMLPLIISDGRRRVSTIPQSELISLAFQAIMTHDPKQRLRLIRQMKLERNQIFHLVNRIQDLSADYIWDMLTAVRTGNPKRRARKLRKLAAVEEALGASRDHWHQAYMGCCCWIQLAHTFKRMIAEKYYKFAFKKATGAKYSTGLDISVSDLYNNYIMAIYRAIDKYDSSRGMLSSYIQMWFKNASSNPDYSHENNIAFEIPASQRRLLQKSNWTDRSGTAIKNFSNPIDETVINQQVLIPDDSELVEKVAQLGRRLNLRTFMLLNNIPYRLSEQQCKAIARSAISINLPTRD